MKRIIKKDDTVVGILTGTAKRCDASSGVSQQSQKISLQSLQKISLIIQARMNGIYCLNISRVKSQVF